MLISWYGQARLHIETSSGTRIICDPYDSDTGYSVPPGEADIVTVSHDHFDHNALNTVKGGFQTIRSEGEYEVKGVKITGTGSWHDAEGGKKRGPNIIFRFEADNMTLVHMGDIGEIISGEQSQALRPCDILAVPVGGVYTVDAAGAFEIARMLDPRIVIPIHYDTPSNRIGLDDAEGFLSRFIEVRRVKQWDGCRADLPGMQTVYAFKALGEK